MDDAFLKDSNHLLWAFSKLKFNEIPNLVSAIPYLNIDL